MKRTILLVSFFLSIFFSFGGSTYAKTYYIEDNGSGVVDIKIRRGDITDTGILELLQPTLVDLTFSVFTQNHPSIDDFLVVPESGFLTESGDTLASSLIYSFKGVLNTGTYDFSVTGMGKWFSSDWGIYTIKGSLNSDPSAIPIPASIWLLFSALLGFMIAGHRRRPDKLLSKQSGTVAAT